MSKAIITVAGKGGVGKTSICAAIVRQLVKAYPDQRILAIDADPAVGLATALGIQVGTTVDDIRKAITQAGQGDRDKRRAKAMLGEVKFRLFDAMTETRGFAFIAVGRPEAAGCYCGVNAYLKEVIIDIGGQDVKGIAIDSDGTVKTFAMNDKCAAGTGRFFEAMANAFECTLDEFSQLSLTAKNVIPITAQCTVFAESEVITLVGEGKPRDEIAAGIQQAVAKRCFVMAKKAGARDQVTLTGGCAKNAGLKQAIENVLRIKVVELNTDPQLMGALGAAEYARQKGMDLD